MKLIQILSLVFLLSIVTLGQVLAQEVAITQRGDTVYLYSNGTWDYYGSSIEKAASAEIPYNDQTFTKPKSATKKVNGKENHYAIWYNEKNWKRIPTGELNPEADLTFKYVKGDAYVMVIHEELEIELENLVDIALENALSVAPDMVVTKKEYRNVNGQELIFMQMDGTTQGMKISYYSYYSSNESGSTQFHTFTGQNLLSKYKKDMDSILNGFVIE
ncbi:MAG: hypothetical protein OCD76_12615 [Reichenbachiella sp.]